MIKGGPHDEQVLLDYQVGPVSSQVLTREEGGRIWSQGGGVRMEAKAEKVVH